MIFRKLKMQNIRSYKNLEIEFPEGTILLSGDIGAGKTSILLGLQFALFGLQPGQKGASILKQGEEKAHVCLDIEVDGIPIRLERGLKQSSNGSITQDSNILTIEDRREELSTSEMKTRVIEILKYPKEFAKKSNLLYKFTVYTPQEGMKEIIEERPEIRLDTLRHVFGVDRYKRIKENTQTFIQKIKESIKIKEVLVNELNILKEKLANESERKIKLAREINNLTIEYKKLEDEKTSAEEKLSESKEVIAERDKIKNELSNEKIALEGKLDIRTRIQRELHSMKSQLNEKIDFSQERLNSVNELIKKHQQNLEEVQSKHMALTSRISVLESKKEQPTSLKEKITSLENCPTCLQRVSEEHKERISKKTQYEIDDINRELESKIQQKEQTINELEREKNLLRNYEQDKSKLEQDKIKFEHQKTIDTKMKSEAFVLDRTNNEIQSLEKKIAELTEKLDTFKESETKYEENTKVFEEKSNDLKKHEISLAEKNKELELLKKILQDLSEEISKKEKIREDINKLRSLQDWIQDKFLGMVTYTEKNVLAKLRNDFSNLFSEWFSALVPEKLSVRLDEDFTPIIINQDYEIEYDFLSGGERTAIALAYRLALNQILNSILSKIKTKNLVILDEPTDGFSSEQLDKMRDLFEQLNSRQLILVSHEQKIEGFVDHVIRIRKDETSVVESKN